MELRLVLCALQATMFPTNIEAIETGIANANSRYVTCTVDIKAIATRIKKSNSCYVTVDVEVIDTGIGSTKSHYVPNRY